MAALNFLVAIVGFLCCIVHGACQYEQANEHRIFPAAKVESYTEGNALVGSIKPDEFSYIKNWPVATEPIITPAIERFQKSLHRYPDFKDSYGINPDGLELHQVQSLNIKILSGDVQLYHGVDESYEIEIDQAAATLLAQTVFGALRALESFAQLHEFGWMEGEEPVYLIRGIPLLIADQPAYGFRGLLIDTSRHYLPLNLILDTLDIMAMNKMNILHWHIVDEQSFPYQMESFPEIAEMGAFHPKLIYTTENIKSVIQEAYIRGIRVVPEVDLPGHTSAIAKSHPELMSHCPDPTSPVNPTIPEIYDFVEGVYTDLNNLFPDSMVHLGGDEVNLDCWKKSHEISHWMKEHNMTDVVELYEYFETRLLRIVDKFEKTPIVWQEVFNLNLTITKNTIVDVWKGFDKATIEAAVAQNFQVIVSGCWYLDHLHNSWQDYYMCDLRNFTGNKALVIGGHASMWGEHVDSSNFVSRIWPRASAAAERLWTGDVSIAEQTIEERLQRFRCHMVQQGVAAGPTGPGFCPHEVPHLREYGPRNGNRCSAAKLHRQQGLSANLKQG